MAVRAAQRRQQSASVTADDRLLQTRLFVPPVPPDRVDRPRLHARVEQGLQRKLLLVTAPAGSGKTTLLSAWRATDAGQAWPLAWVSLTADDDHPPRFWSYVIAALDALVPGIGEEALALLRPPQQAPPERVLTELINHLSALPDDIVVVLDDYHLITNPAVHAGVAFLIEHMPPQMHVILAAQADPPLPLARLRAHGALAELHAADLRFTAEEAADFLTRTMGLPLAPDDVALLEAETEGWIAGLQLVALALQGLPPGSDVPAAYRDGHRFIVDYLAAEVLARQPEDVQAFLLDTAILDRFNAPLCDAVTGAGNAAAMLDRLERANLFLVRLDEDWYWYRYHHLFGTFLRAHRARTRPATAPALHARAAAWFTQAGMINEAVRHAAAAGDLAQAADLVIGHAPMHFMRSEVASVHAWLDLLPPALVQTRPQLGITRAWALAHDYRVEEAEQALATVAQVLAAHPAVVPDDERLGIEGEMAAIRARLAAFRKETGAAITLARQALDLLPASWSFSRSEISLSLAFAFLDQEDLDCAEEALAEAIALCRAAGNTRGVMYAVRYLGWIYWVRGRLHQAAALYRGHLAEAGDAPPTGFVHAALAQVLLEWNDVDGALAHATQAVRLATQGGDGKMLLHAYGPLILAQQAHGDSAAALATADRLNRLAPGLYHAAVRAEVWLAQGNVAAAAAWARTSGLDPAAPPSFLVEHETLDLARVLLAEARTAEAIPLLAALRAGAEAGHRAGVALSVRVWLAVAHARQGATAAALAALAPAVALALTEGHIGPFLAAGPEMAALLRRLPAPPDAAAAAAFARLLAAFPTPGLLPAPPTPPAAAPAGPAPAAVAPLVEPLSEREIAVLRLVASGHSNAAIARDLVVTVGTVKTHLRNAYGKLDVHSRTQAVARARALRLI